MAAARWMSSTRRRRIDGGRSSSSAGPAALVGDFVDRSPSSKGDFVSRGRWFIARRDHSDHNSADARRIQNGRGCDARSFIALIAPGPLGVARSSWGRRLAGMATIDCRRIHTPLTLRRRGSQSKPSLTLPSLPDAGQFLSKFIGKNVRRVWKNRRDAAAEGRARRRVAGPNVRLARRPRGRGPQRGCRSDDRSIDQTAARAARRRSIAASFEASQQLGGAIRLRSSPPNGLRRLVPLSPSSRSRTSTEPCPSHRPGMPAVAPPLPRRP